METFAHFIHQTNRTKLLSIKTKRIQKWKNAEKWKGAFSCFSFFVFSTNCLNIQSSTWGPLCALLPFCGLSFWIWKIQKHIHGKASFPKHAKGRPQMNLKQQQKLTEKEEEMQVNDEEKNGRDKHRMKTWHNAWYFLSFQHNNEIRTSKQFWWKGFQAYSLHIPYLILFIFQWIDEVIESILIDK